MKMFRCLALILALCYALFPAMAEEEMSDDALREMLLDLYEKQQEGMEFLVLPDDFRPPAAGLDGVYRLLIIGVDSDREDMKGRSDTMVLALLNEKQQSIKLVSFMRDLYVSIPGHGHNRLNAAYAFGGQALLRKTLKENFGVEADGFVAVNYSLLVDLVDAIGGVELTVEDFELRPLNGILEYYNRQKGRPKEEGRLKEAGTRVLTGLQTMSYARIRKPDSDFERVQRQQKVLKRIYEKLRAMDSGQVLDVLISFIDRISTDISLSQALGLTEDLLSLDEMRIQGLSVPVKNSFSSRMINRAYFLVPNLRRNSEAVLAFLDEAPALP